MKNRRFFDAIYKINSILFLLLMIALLLLSVSLFINMFPFELYENQNTVEVAAVDQDTSENRKFQLGYMRNIYGSDTYIIELRTVDATYKLSSSGEQSVISNILFVTGDDMESHWLFDNNDQVILNYNQIYFSNENTGGFDKTYQISMSLYKYDTNKDGNVSIDDDITKILTDPLGERVFELGTYENVIRAEFNEQSNQYIILAYRNGDFIFQRFDIFNQSLIFEEKLSEISIASLE